MFRIILCLLLISFSIHVEAQRVQKISSEQGLSSSFIFEIQQSSEGYMYIGTVTGLNRYDGYEVVQFRHDPYDEKSISNSSVNCIVEDKRGYIWIALENGSIDVFDPKSQIFYHFGKFGNQYSKHQKIVPDIVFDKEDNLWISVQNGKVKKFNLPLDFNIVQIHESKNVQDYLSYEFDIPKNPNYKSKSKQPPFIKEFVHDATNHLYGLTSDSQIIYIDSKKNEKEIIYSHFKNNDTRSIKFLPHPTKGLFIKLGELLIQLDGNSAQEIALNDKTKDLQFHHIDNNGKFWCSKNINSNRFFYQNELNEIINGNISLHSKLDNKNNRKIFVDRTNMFWILDDIGVSLFNPNNNKFNHYLKGKSIYQVDPIDNENVFLVEKGNRTKIFNTKSHELVDISTFSPKINFDIFHLIEIDDSVYLGQKFPFERAEYEGQKRNPSNHKKGLFKYDFRTKELNEFKFSLQINRNSIVDQNKRIWSSNKENSFYTIEQESMEMITWTDNSVFDKMEGIIRTESMYLDHANNVWIATTTGVIKTNSSQYPHQSPKFSLFQNKPTDKNSLSNNHVKCIVNDQKNPERYLWIGTSGGGLNKYNLETGEFTHFTTKNSNIPDDVVYQIQFDKDNNLWLSTNNGISRFNSEKIKFVNFSMLDGLQHVEFNSNSSAQMPDGTMLFGGIEGLNIFHPDDLDEEWQGPNPKIRITDFYINNERQKLQNAINPKAKLPNLIDYTNRIDLQYHQNTLAFKFSVLDYSNSKKNEYQYRFISSPSNNYENEEWVNLGTDHKVQFTNLNHGTYKFQVKGANVHGRWTENIETVDIHISPPWWQSKLAYLVYILGILGALYFIYSFQIRRAKLLNDLDYKQKEAERLKELDNIKTSFFSNITHEFRTPLTLILEPLRQLIKEDNNGEIAQRLHLAKHNSEKLLLLVNQLLDVSKLEAGKMNLDLRKGELPTVLLPIFDSFEVLAKQKKLNFSLTVDEGISEFHFDKSHIEKVFYNLLSNAIKFTNDGQVLVEISTLQNNDIKISVTDSGEGIESKDLPHVFERFYQTKSSSQNHVAGTGIGLALTKELVELMKGTIHVDSVPTVGSTFAVVIPTTLIPVNNEDTNENITYSSNNQEKSPFLTSHETQETIITNDQWDTVLVVEDNPELRQFIAQSIAKKYNVIHAQNGEEGIQIALDKIPDLIISDISMPKKDGIELVESLKADVRTSHIPIILLTAKSSIESKLEGLRHGAEGYLTKPFHTEELLIRISNLIEIRKQLQNKYANNLSLSIEASPKDDTLSKIDKDFLENIKRILESNLSNEKFSVETFSKSVFMSRIHLFRKIKALLGISPTEFINNYRLDKSLELLKNNDKTVIQVSMEVGFNSEKYFSKKFKERFGVSPSQVK